MGCATENERAALTTLGIIIGVAAVITMMEIGNGASMAIQHTMASMGANTLVILPGALTTAGISNGTGSIMTLTPQDADAIQAVTLCLLGGTMGIVLGRTGSYVVSLALGWPTAVSFAAILAAVLVSATVGIVFGFYPAYKASRLDLIEALRDERNTSTTPPRR